MYNLNRKSKAKSLREQIFDEFLKGSLSKYAVAGLVSSDSLIAWQISPGGVEIQEGGEAGPAGDRPGLSDHRVRDQGEGAL